MMSSQVNNKIILKKNIPSLRIFFIENNLILKGPLGVLSYNFDKQKLLENHFSLLNIIAVDKYIKKAFISILNKLIIGVCFGWFSILTISGRGFSFRLKENNLLKIKIGYSHFILYEFLINNFFIKISKKKNKLLVFSLNFWKLNKLIYQIRNIRSKHTYKIQGVKFLKEDVQIKPGKQKQI